MTGDIPPACLLDHICTNLEIDIKEPKQQHWQRVETYLSKRANGYIGDWPPHIHPASVTSAGIKGIEAAYIFQFAQDDKGTIYWAEIPMT